MSKKIRYLLEPKKSTFIILNCLKKLKKSVAKSLFIWLIKSNMFKSLIIDNDNAKRNIWKNHQNSIILIFLKNLYIQNHVWANAQKN